MLVLVFTLHMIHDTKEHRQFIIGLQLSSSACLFTVTPCEIAMLIWGGILTQADRAGPPENLLLRSEAWSCAATTVDFLVLSDGAHRTRNIFKLIFMCSAHDGESQIMYKYEFGERARERERECVCVCLWVCVCVCVFVSMCVCLWVWVWV